MPGAATGLFWTTAIADAGVEPAGGGALLQLTNAPLFEAFQIFTSPSVPASLTLRAQFLAGTQANLATTSQGAAFAFVGTKATVDLSFSVTSQNSRTDTSAYSFATSGSSTTSFGRIGNESNGSFLT